MGNPAAPDPDELDNLVMNTAQVKVNLDDPNSDGRAFYFCGVRDAIEALRPLINSLREDKRARDAVDLTTKSLQW